MNVIRPIDPVAHAAAIIDLWNRRAGATFPLDERLLLQQLRMERGPSLCLGAFEPADDRGRPRREAVGRAPDACRRDSGERLVGVALAKQSHPGPGVAANPPAGFLSFIVVDESTSRRGIGTALLGRAEDWLAESAIPLLRFGGDRYHFFPGLPLDGSPAAESLAAFLAARGFESDGATDDHDLVADLAGLDLPAIERLAPLPPGFRFRLYADDVRAATDAFLRREFPGRWHSEFVEALEAGMRDSDLALLVEEASGQVVAFSRIYDRASPVLGGSVYWRGLMGAAPGGLGPIGVARSLRGQGIGLAFLRLCVEELARRGVGRMVIDWTTLGSFYGKLGFCTWKTYRRCSKRLGPAENR
jgi:predicted N-acetyltransferase YhbS